MSEKEWVIDPRTGLALLVLSNVIAFTQQNIWVEAGWVLLLGLLLIVCGCKKTAVKSLLVFAFLLCLQWYILPVSPKIIATSFSIFANYSRRMFSCMMIGLLLIKKVPLKKFIVAMRKLHVPQKLITAVSVTLRYIPAIREESRHIRDAMRLQNIRGVQKVEALVVPLMVSAAGTAEELSAAAVTRGVENPAPKTSITELSFGMLDRVYLLLGAAFTVAAFVVK